jgi:hypothetical protein
MLRTSHWFCRIISAALILGAKLAAGQTCPAGTPTSTVTLPATSSWVSTGIFLAAEDRVVITAAGKWRTPSSDFSDYHTYTTTMFGPWGSTVVAFCYDCPVPRANLGVLIGRIGSHPPFVIGKTIRFFVNRTWNGELKLMMNDVLLGDNTGSLTVKIRECPPPH